MQEEPALDFSSHYNHLNKQFRLNANDCFYQLCRGDLLYSGFFVFIIQPLGLLELAFVEGGSERNLFNFDLILQEF